MAAARTAAVLSIALLSSTAVACRRPHGRGADSNAAITDEIGRRVVPRHLPAQRIVSLAPSVTELLFAIGAGSVVVGVDNYSDHPATDLARVRRVGSNYDPSLETILALAPDVVLTAKSANRQETVGALERLGVPCFVTDTRRAEDIDTTLRHLGALTGRAGAAEREIDRLHTALKAVRDRATGQPPVRTLVVVWSDPLYVAGGDTFTQDILEMAGGVNVASDASGFARYAIERVLKAAPDVMVLPTHAAETKGAQAIAYWSRWPSLPAVRTKRIHAVEDALLIRPGPRLAEAAETLFRLLHPQP